MYSRTLSQFIIAVKLMAYYFIWLMPFKGRSRWPRGLGRRSAAVRLLGLWVRIPPVAWTSFCCDCRVLSGRGLCDELITRPEESYRLWCVVVCDLKTSWMRRPWPTGGCCVKKNVLNIWSEHNYIFSHRLVQTTTCFGPVYWSSSGCIINLISNYTVCAWVIPAYRGFGGLVVSVLASGTQDRGFKPGRSRRVFRSFGPLEEK